MIIWLQALTNSEFKACIRSHRDNTRMKHSKT